MLFVESGFRVKSNATRSPALIDSAQIEPLSPMK
jgi:hypothetical protein